MKTLLDPDRAVAYGLTQIRAEFQVPDGFPPAVLAAAEAAVRRTPFQRSVPVKPLGGRFSPGRLHGNRIGFAMSPRQAAALVATAIANRILLEPGAVLPRRLTVDGVAMAVENGVGRDILSSGMATIADATVGTETLALTTAGYRYIVSELGRPMLEGAGVLLPELGASAA